MPFPLLISLNSRMSLDAGGSGASELRQSCPALLSAGCPTSPSLVGQTHGHSGGHTDTRTCEWAHGYREGQTDTRLPGVGWGGSAQGGVSPVVVQDRLCQCLLGAGWGEGRVSGELALECCNQWMSFEMGCSIEAVCSTVLMSNNF